MSVAIVALTLRGAALPGFVSYYNGYRPHGGLDGDTPLGRLTRSTTS